MSHYSAHTVEKLETLLSERGYVKGEGFEDESRYVRSFTKGEVCVEVFVFDSVRFVASLTSSSFGRRVEEDTLTALLRKLRKIVH